jgi:hypothetical protein
LVDIVVADENLHAVCSSSIERLMGLMAKALGLAHGYAQFGCR